MSQYVWGLVWANIAYLSAVCNIYSQMGDGSLACFPIPLLQIINQVYCNIRYFKMKSNNKKFSNQITLIIMYVKYTEGHLICFLMVGSMWSDEVVFVHITCGSPAQTYDNIISKQSELLFLRLMIVVCRLYEGYGLCWGIIRLFAMVVILVSVHASMKGPPYTLSDSTLPSFIQRPNIHTCQIGNSNV